MKISKFKLKYKDINNSWALEGPFIKEKNPNYHLLLVKGISCAKSSQGELHVYNKDGSLKEVVKYYMS